MVLDDASDLDAVAAPDGLTIRQLAPDEAELHVMTAAAGFGAPEHVFRHLVTHSSLSLPGVRAYLGEAGDHPVTTGIGMAQRGSVGIFNIATPPEHRGRGYGAAVTARAVADGLGGGSRYAYLQSSPDGFSVYLRLGFRTVEEWRCWLSPPDHPKTMGDVAGPT
jgi:predicted GNAT family acetyltransferase